VRGGWDFIVLGAVGRIPLKSRWPQRVQEHHHFETINGL
jgi:hypothetical protein